MEKILKYGDKIYIGRCKSENGVTAKCIVEEILLNNTNLLNNWRGKILKQYINLYGHHKEPGVFSHSGLISRCLSNCGRSIIVISNDKTHLKNRIKTEMYKKGIDKVLIDFIDF